MSERLTPDEYGLDEIWIENVDLHIERMDNNSVWIGIYRHGAKPDKRISIFYGAKGTIKANVVENDLLPAPERGGKQP